MKCYGKNCDGDLRILNTYTVGRTAKTHSARCVLCGKRHTFVTMSFESPPGTSARAVQTEMKRRLARGEGFVHGANGAEVRIQPTRKEPDG